MSCCRYLVTLFAGFSIDRASQFPQDIKTTDRKKVHLLTVASGTEKKKNIIQMPSICHMYQQSYPVIKKQI